MQMSALSFEPKEQRKYTVGDIFTKVTKQQLNNTLGLIITFTEYVL